MTIISNVLPIIWINIFIKLCFCAILHDLVDVRGNNAIRAVRILYVDQTGQRGTYQLIRDRPMFAEVDFVPTYIPQLTYYVAVSVILPKQIRSSGSGGPWILGWHQEKFDIPTCRLCTNLNQSYTIPVTLFLPDDGWCPQGPVPTGWKVEALAQNPNARDNTDMIIGVSIDQHAQIYISNSDKTIKCKNVNEAFNYTNPVDF